MSEPISLEQLREEYRTGRIGRLILDDVTRVVLQVVRNYDPQIYGGAASWEDAGEDIVQAVVVDLLLGEGQLDYIMATAARMEDWTRLLRFQVKRYLARQRRRSVVDNLLDRAKPLLGEAPFQEFSSPKRYGLAGVDLEDRQPTDAELSEAARSAALIPRIRFSAGERAPVVYSEDALKGLLVAVAGTLPAPFTLSDIGKILEMVLTDWVASFLYEFDEAYEPEVSLGPEEKLIANEVAEQILENCSEEQLVILRRKLENVSDQAIARELGVSRPTVHARKKEAWDRLREALDDLPESIQAAAIELVATRLVTTVAGGGNA